jgi:hypothetical protein
MASKKKKPPAAADAGRLRNMITATAIGSENNDPHARRQDFRIDWIARRFNLSLSTASTVADLAFLQREAAR